MRARSRSLPPAPTIRPSTVAPPSDSVMGGGSTSPTNSSTSWDRRPSMATARTCCGPRCSILFHLLVPGGERQTVRARPVSSATRGDPETRTPVLAAKHVQPLFIYAAFAQRRRRVEEGRGDPAHGRVRRLRSSRQGEAGKLGSLGACTRTQSAMAASQGRIASSSSAGPLRRAIPRSNEAAERSGLRNRLVANAAGDNHPGPTLTPLPALFSCLAERHDSAEVLASNSAGEIVPACICA